MKKIKSFEVDHTKIEKGLYISRVDENIITYDLRMVKPNTPPYLENAGIHTFEHLLATYLRNSNFENNTVYVGPMGCRTGFYILLKDVLKGDALNLIKSALDFIKNFSGNIPGATEKECGNFREHDLKTAKVYAKDLADVLKNWKLEDLNYNKNF